MESSSSSNDHYEISTYIGAETDLNISTHRIAKQLDNSEDNQLNNHLRRLYKEQTRRKKSQERRKKFAEKWGILFCCCLS